MDKIPMTAVGHKTLEEELERRIRDERPHLIERIRQAIADEPNLVENSEYQAAKADQEINEMRIAELEDKLARADIIDVSKLSGDTIRFGATVTLIDEESEPHSCCSSFVHPPPCFRHGFSAAIRATPGRSSDTGA
jgi:transcription elongation factor GreA